jgi:hypothetical protein
MFHDFDSAKIELRLFQMTPREALLNLDPMPVTLSLLETGHVLEDSPVFQAVNEARSIGELLQRVAQADEGLKERNRRLSWVMRTTLANSEVGHSILWKPSRGGIPLEEPITVGEAAGYRLLRAPVATLHADRVTDGRVYFTAQIHHRIFFEENPSLELFADELLGGQAGFYVFDRRRRFTVLLNYLKCDPLYMKIQGRNRRLREVLLESGRISEAEAYGKNDWVVAYCHAPTNEEKRYAFLPRDLGIIASTRLVRAVETRRKVSEELAALAELCKQGVAEAKASLQDRAFSFEKLEAALAQWFEPTPAVAGRLFKFPVFGRNSTALKHGKQVRRDFGRPEAPVALAYPIVESDSEKEHSFMTLFDGKTGGQMRKHGKFRFERFHYSMKAAEQRPAILVERLREEVGEVAGVLMAWRRYGRLYHHRLVEFELLRAGIPVQHVIDIDGRGQQNAVKIGNLLQGMSQKFSVGQSRADLPIEPFDLAMGLDVSRYNREDIPAFPVLADREGQASCLMSEELSRARVREKREESEILQALQTAIAGRSDASEIHILFLRDGYAYEDYDTIATQLPDNVTLTVISVRKNLISMFGEQGAIPVGEASAVYADHDTSRFLFGVNARFLDDTSSISQVHQAEVVRNPLGLARERLGEILVCLSRANQASEAGLSSLPFPIAYADRMAGAVRELVHDARLKRYVRDTYRDAVEEAQGESRYIYQVIRDFVLNHPNGPAFAV